MNANVVWEAAKGPSSYFDASFRQITRTIVEKKQF